MAQDAFVDVVVFFEYFRVYAVIGCRIATCYDIRGNVARNAATALYERIDACADTMVQDYAAGEYDVVVEGTVARNLRMDAHHAMIADVNVVTDVYAVHKEVFVANRSGCGFVKASCDDHILAYAVAITNFNVRRMAVDVAEALGGGSDYGILIDKVSLTHFHTVEDG